MCRWMGSHFHNWMDYDGVTFLELSTARLVLFFPMHFCVVLQGIVRYELNSTMWRADIFTLKYVSQLVAASTLKIE